MYIAVDYFSKWTELFENTKKKKVEVQWISLNLTVE